ncbi:TetR/AcrR family transcriptional regulator [Streptomyces sp. NPDC000410]|uniref:TetR/AcrR family transcriptional regulator n=1 Tax=Streptomyces sp. NPDC000410 TaxID=3154254 RepID=UPI003321BA1C
MGMRSTAAQRRVEAIEAGMRVFADHGLTTTAVQRIADEIGVSQPYVFRLFGSKRAFFLACMDEMEARVREVFRQTAAASPDEPFEAMGAGFRDLIADGVISGLWVQSCAAARADEVIAARCRTFVAGLLEEVDQATGAGADALAQFLATGALVMVLQAVGANLTEGSRGAIEALRVAETFAAPVPDEGMAAASGSAKKAAR